MELSEITLSINEVRDCLSILDPSKATGLDGIPARILKECSVQIAPSLCSLFNHSLRTVLGGFHQNGSQLMLLRFIKKIF